MSCHLLNLNGSINLLGNHSHITLSVCSLQNEGSSFVRSDRRKCVTFYFFTDLTHLTHTLICISCGGCFHVFNVIINSQGTKPGR